MTTCGEWPVGVCSWSLQKDIEGVAEAMKKIGLRHVHLGVGPVQEEGGDAVLAAMTARDWIISSTMIGFPQEDYTTLETIKETGGIVPDAYWEQNRTLFLKALETTETLGVKQISMHAGFLDHSQPASAEKFAERIKVLADAARKKGILLLLETGQESAEDLRKFLQEVNHPALGVNFDPANMILYDKGNPVEALKILAPWIRHVHIKDAVKTKEPGTWGAEVPWGDGDVGAAGFLKALKEIQFSGTLAIEREAGDDRFGDIQLAAKRLSEEGEKV
jgi:sugar phosphate isomerase/epimerase